MYRTIYITPALDERTELDRQRMAHLPEVGIIVVNFQEGISVQDAVRPLAARCCTTLLLPDDYHRHNELIEHVKACAYHMGMEVMPVNRYVTKYPPAPDQTTPVHANPEPTGAGRGLPAAASAG